MRREDLRDKGEGPFDRLVRRGSRRDGATGVNKRSDDRHKDDGLADLGSPTPRLKRRSIVAGATVAVHIPGFCIYYCYICHIQGQSAMVSF